MIYLTSQDIVCLHKDGTRTWLGPGQCARYFNNNFRHFEDKVAGLWIASAVAVAVNGSGGYVLDTGRHSGPSGLYRGWDVRLASPGGLHLAYNPCAESMLLRHGFGLAGDSVLVHELLEDDFQKLIAHSRKCSGILPEHVPTLFIESTSTSRKALKAQPIPMYCEGKLMEMLPLDLPVLITKYGQISKQAGCREQDVPLMWQHLLNQITFAADAEYMYLGWLPDTSIAVDPQKEYNASEYHATGARRMHTWTTCDPHDPLYQIDVRRGTIPSLLKHGYLPCANHGSLF